MGHLATTHNIQCDWYIFTDNTNTWKHEHTTPQQVLWHTGIHKHFHTCPFRSQKVTTSILSNVSYSRFFYWVHCNTFFHPEKTCQLQLHQVFIHRANCCWIWVSGIFSADLGSVWLILGLHDHSTITLPLVFINWVLTQLITTRHYMLITIHEDGYDCRAKGGRKHTPVASIGNVLYWGCSLAM